MGVGIFCVRPEQGWMALLISDRMGSKVARRLLPAAILIPLVNGLLELRGERLGFYDAEFGAALVSTSNIVLLGAFDLVDRHLTESCRSAAPGRGAQTRSVPTYVRPLQRRDRCHGSPGTLH